MARSAKKCEKDEKAEKLKLKKVCTTIFNSCTLKIIDIVYNIGSPEGQS